MSLINKEVNDFEVKAFQNDEFKTVKKEDILGKWSVFFFYPAVLYFRRLISLLLPRTLCRLYLYLRSYNTSVCCIYLIPSIFYYIYKLMFFLNTLYSF